MSQSRNSMQSRSHSRQGSITNNNNQSQQNSYQNGYIKSTTQNFPTFINQTLIFMLEKLIQLTQMIMNNKDNISMNSHIAHKSAVLNLTDKKNKNNISPSTPPISNSYHRDSKQREPSFSKIILVKNDFEKIKQRLAQYKNTCSIQFQLAEDLAKNAFDLQENQLTLIRIQEQFSKQFRQVKDRLSTIQQDLGQMLIIYKEDLTYS